MDPIALERAFEIYPEMKVVVVARLYGMPGKIGEIRTICQKHDTIIIEGVTESLGASCKGVRTGTFGHYNAISFNDNKITTGSSGRILLTDDLEAANKVREWSTQSRENVPWYQHEELGYSCRMNNVITGVMRGQFPYLEGRIAQKKAIYEGYKSGLKDLPVIMSPFDTRHSESNYWLSYLLIDKDVMRKQICGKCGALYISESGKSCPIEILEELAQYNTEGRPV